MRIISVIWLTAASAFLAGCKPPEFLQKKRENATTAVKDLSIAGEDGSVSGNFSANSSSNQRVTATGSIAGSSVLIAPGSLSIDTVITMQEGATVATADLFSELKVGKNSVTSSAAAVVISSSAGVDPAGALVIGIPTPSSAGLLLTSDDFSNLVVVYLAEIKASGTVVSGVIPRSAIKIDKGQAIFETKFFGAYQAVLMKDIISEKIETTTKQQIATKQGKTLVTPPAPTPLAATLSIKINNDDEFATKTTVELTLAAATATSMYVTNVDDCSSGGTWEPMSATKSDWTLGQTEGLASVSVKFRNNDSAESKCISDAITHDGIAPAPPTLTTISPTSPSNIYTPTLIGTAASADTDKVIIYNDAACTNILATKNKSEYEGFGVLVTVAVNTANSLYGVAVDRAGNRSSTCPLLTTFVNDSTIPVAPVFVSTTPASPSMVLTPTLIGTAADSDTSLVSIYSDVACSTLLGSGTKAVFESTGISLTVLANTSTSFYGVTTDSAGNLSAGCTLLTTYVNDQTPPTPPTFTSTLPASPSRLNATNVIGVSSADTVTIALYSEATCTTALGSGVKALFESTGIPVTVSANATSTIYARALDLPGNATACTLLTSYVSDTSVNSPTSPMARSNDEEVELSWITGGGDTTGYLVVRDIATPNLPTQGSAYSAGNSISSSKVVYSGASTTFSDTDPALTNGTKYFYHVHAVDALYNYSSPILVTSIPHGGFKAVSAGGGHTCALSAVGKAYCWGSGALGQLGSGSTGNQSKPMAVDVSYMPLTDRTFTKISTGLNHTCGISAGGKLFCWGANDSGQVGDATIIQKNSPVEISYSTDKWRDVSAGTNHTCGIIGNGSAVCWGDNASGQLGNGTTTLSSSATPSGSSLKWLQITAGNKVTCGIKSSGTPMCWGSDSEGQVGNGSPTGDQVSPVNLDDSSVTGSKNFISIFASNSSTSTYANVCAIAVDGKAYCWGSGASGQIGDNGFANRDKPAEVNVSGLSNRNQSFIQLASGQKSTCAVTGTGLGYCWGTDNVGQLGNSAGQSGDKGTPFPITTTNLRSNERVQQIVGGANHFCALTSRGAIYCWGDNGTTAGRLGVSDVTTATTQEITVSVDVLNLAGASSGAVLSSGTNHTCAISTVGKAFCWGSDAFGQQGNGAVLTANQTIPSVIDETPFAGGTPHFKKISVGPSHTCGIAADGRGWCWGDQSNGALGNALTSGVAHTPVLIPITSYPDLVFKDIVAGNQFSCAISTTGTAYCWGANNVHQLGDSVVAANRSTISPVDVANLPAGEELFSKISSGDAHSCGLSSENKLYCWGSSSSGQIGDGFTTDRLLPTLTSASSYFLSDVTAGSNFSCGIRDDGAGFCWGNDTNGNLGNDVGISTSSPIAIDTTGIASNTFRAIKAGAAHACALAYSGELYCWGSSSSKQTGTNNTADLQSPTLVDPTVFTGSSDYGVTFSCGGNSSLMIISNGAGYGWGANATGQLGNNSNSASVGLPTQIN